jgi:hypothetical protein
LDDKELVARTRSTSSFKVMQAITPWAPDANAAAPLRRAEAFEYFYSQRREHGTLWRRLAEECFPAESAEVAADKARTKALSGRTPGAVLEELRKLKAAGAGTLSWLEALARGGPDDMLLLRRAALRAGPGSPEWTAASLAWGAASARTRALAAGKYLAAALVVSPPRLACGGDNRCARCTWATRRTRPSTRSTATTAEARAWTTAPRAS